MAKEATRNRIKRKAATGVVPRPAWITGKDAPQMATASIKANSPAKLGNLISHTWKRPADGASFGPKAKPDGGPAPARRLFTVALPSGCAVAEQLISLQAMHAEVEEQTSELQSQFQ